jgi:hypothetical protein
MHGFVKRLVAPLLTRRGWTRVCEIGASYGASTDVLASVPNLAITVVDPCLDTDLEHKYADKRGVTVRKGASLDVLPSLDGPFDCILIDGDHNWYTVYNELRIISERRLLQEGGMVFFHDVDWPYGRRDMYFRPDLIPAEYRHECQQKGLVRNQSNLSELAGFNSAYWNATREGGPKNGVLTAIEDFISEQKGGYSFFYLKQQYGLGVMCRRRGITDDWSMLQMRAACAAYKLVASSKRLLLTGFPSVFHHVKSLLRRGKPVVQGLR